MERTEVYDQEKRKHYYFMLLKGDEVCEMKVVSVLNLFD